MIITLDNLAKGIDWWQQRSKWHTDFLNSEYYDIYNDRAAAVTNDWWQRTVGRLSQWRAFRGPIPPNTKDEIDKRGQRILDQVSNEYERLRKGEPSITDMRWEDIDSLFQLISGVKPLFLYLLQRCVIFCFRSSLSWWITQPQAFLMTTSSIGVA